MVLHFTSGFWAHLSTLFSQIIPKEYSNCKFRLFSPINVKSSQIKRKTFSMIYSAAINLQLVGIDYSLTGCI